MLDLVDRRNRDFALRVAEITSIGKGSLSIEEIADAARKSAAPCYYATYSYALRMTSLVIAGRLPVKNTRRNRMWHEFAAKVRKRMERSGCRYTHAIAYVLASATASEFFISHDRALTLARNYVKYLKS